MFKRVLFTYSDFTELHKYEKEQMNKGIEIYSYIHAENEQLLEYIDNVIIDISSIVIYLNVNNGNQILVESKLDNLDNSCIIIIEETYAKIALKMFPYIFNEIKPIYKKISKKLKIPIIKPTHFYIYTNSNYLKQITRYVNENKIPLASFPTINEGIKACFDEFNNSNKIAIVDLTSLTLAIEDNKNIMYISEQFLSIYKNVKYIVKANQADILMKYFPLYFDGFEPVSNILKGLNPENEIEDMKEKKRCITDLNNEEFLDFCSYIRMNLIGHNFFKKKLFQYLENFRILNKVNDQKVLSIFLFGMSGIGKTEVARLIAEKLQRNSYLSKINFANYSSQDALNILIGSPRGYIGCEHGELSEKVSKSKIGLILCDEFEKANRPVYSFFLELLEDGKFTDSMAKEYDINGYIVVFTSNILDEETYEKIIPPELKTRFDLVCRFKEPSKIEKYDFLNLLFNKASINYSIQFNDYNISNEDKEFLYNFDYKNIHSLRDIKREFQKKLIELFNSRYNKKS